MNAQIPLSFPVKEAMNADDYMVLPCNQDAYAWIQKYPDWSYPALIVYGEEGSGKTHLLNLCTSMTGDDMAIDNTHEIFGDLEKEKDLFHRFNLAKEQGQFLLLTMDRAVAQQDIKLPDLASRLRAAPSVEIESPDEVSLEAILVKLFHDRQLQVEPGLISYILPRIERSFKVARDLVETLDRHSLSARRSITVPLVRDILGG